MTTHTDIEDLPEPDSPPGANKPERCNTRIIDPALLADIVPLGPPASRRAASEPPARPVSRAITPKAAESPRSPVPPPTKTRVVGYAPSPARRPQKARRALLVAAGCTALGAVGLVWLARPAPPPSAIASTPATAAAKSSETAAPPGAPLPEPASTAVAPRPAPVLAATAAPGTRAGAPFRSSPGARPPAPPAIPGTATPAPAPATATTGTMVFPSD